MYIITGFTVSPPQKMESNDGKDVADIIIGITGSEEMAKRALLEVDDMNFGETLNKKPYYVIDCVE